MVYKDTAIAAGAGTGASAQLVLAWELNQPGIYPVEQVLSTDLYQKMMRDRQIEIVTNHAVSAI